MHGRGLILFSMWDRAGGQARWFAQTPPGGEGAAPDTALAYIFSVFPARGGQFLTPISTKHGGENDREERIESD